MNSNSLDFKLTAGLLGLSLVVGGAGLSFPLLQMLLGSMAVVVAAFFVVTTPQKPSGALDRWARLLLALILLLPLLQLIPLPPTIWHLLPGREVPKEVDALLGWRVWRPWTLDVEATLRSWLVVIPAAVVFVGCLRIGTQQRVQLLWLIVGFAVLNALLGIVQLATGGGSTPYPSTHLGFPIGFFVNRNHSAAIMLAAMPIAAALGARRATNAQGLATASLAAIAVVAILTIVVIGTTSRTGLLLLPVSLLVSLFILFGRQAPPRLALPALLAIAALGLVLVTSRVFDRALDRFDSLDDPRFVYWSDVYWALQHYGLAGTGVGTFVPVFQSAESLDAVVPQIVNHAHNDFLETLLVGGIPAALLLGAFLILIAVAIHRSIKSARQPEMAFLRFATATGMALLLGFSLVDYPLRMPAIASAFAVFCSVLLPAGRTSDRASGRKLSTQVKSATRSNAWRWLSNVVGLGLLALVLIVMVQAGLSARATLDKRSNDAARLASWSTRANEGQATVEITKGHLGEARRRASVALRLSPISAPAIRDLALVRLLEGSGDEDKYMRISAALGWRDPLTQLWEIGAAQRSGEPDKAVQRAEALFQQHLYVAPALQLLLQAPDLTRVSRLLGSRLAQRPQWRADVFAAVGQLPETDLRAFEGIFARLASSGAPTTSDELKPVLDELIAAGRTAEAQRLWSQLNPDLIDNGDFTAFTDKDGALLPAGWEVPSQNRRAVTVAVYGSNRGDRGLRIAHTDWVSVLSQATMLLPGSYAFSYQAREVGRGPVTLRWQFRCRGSSQKQVAQAELPAGQGWRSFTANFAVPSQDCAIQRLALIRDENSDQSETWLDRIRFARTGH